MEPGGGPIRCFYEVLDLDRKCTTDEVRAAYKKGALKWHPGEEPLLTQCLADRDRQDWNAFRRKHAAPADRTARHGRIGRPYGRHCKSMAAEPADWVKRCTLRFHHGMARADRALLALRLPRWAQGTRSPPPCP